MAIIVPRRIPHFQKPEGLVEIDSSQAPSAFWLAHEGAGTPRDLITSTASVFNGSPEWSVTTQGRVLDFDGVNDDVNTTLADAKFSVSNTSSNITIRFRIFPRNLGGSAGSFSEARVIIAKTAAAGGTASDYEWAVGIEGGTIFVRTSGGNGGALGSLTINQWHDVIVTYEGGVGHTVYINKAKSFGSNTDLSLHNSSWNIVFGRAVYGKRYDGLLHDVRIDDRLLTDAEAERYTDYPYEILKPRRRWVPVVIGGGATVSVGLASELSTAFAISRLKQKAVGLSAETDTALATSPAKVTAVGLSTETDTAFSILRSKIKTAGLSTETDSAFALIISSAVNVGLSDETDSALAINRLKQNPVGLSTETDAALSVGRSKIKIAGLGIETDVAFTTTWEKLKSVGLSSELDQALAISSSGSLAVGLASELDVALVIGRLKQQVLGLPTETDLSQPVSKIKAQQAGLSAESDTALAVTGSSGRIVGLATETDLAQSISRIKQKLIGLAPETDVALSITIAGVTVVINTNAKETLKLLAENPTLTLSAENATLTLS